jgi:hypothetical protein
MKKLDDSEIKSKDPTPHSARRHRINIVGIVLAAGASLGFLYLKDSPAATTASGPQRRLAVSAMSASSERETTSEMDRTFLEANQLAGEFRVLHAVAPVPLTDLKTNPFRFRTSK